MKYLKFNFIILYNLIPIDEPFFLNIIYALLSRTLRDSEVC